MTPTEIEILKYAGSAFALFLSGMTGAHIHKRRSCNWNEDKDRDRRGHTHKSGGNGSNYTKYVPRRECELTHKLEEEKLDNIVDTNNEIKRDIKAIKVALGGI